jgi:hypothetical protein
MNADQNLAMAPAAGQARPVAALGPWSRLILIDVETIRRCRNPLRSSSEVMDNAGSSPSS